MGYININFIFSLQFYYGEDGLDVSKTGFLSPKQFPFLTDNAKKGDTREAIDKKVTKRMKKVDYDKSIWQQNVLVN